MNVKLPSSLPVRLPPAPSRAEATATPAAPKADTCADIFEIKGTSKSSTTGTNASDAVCTPPALPDSFEV